ncbi:MAG: hypothetical protein ACI4Q3_08270 [Kiritimatiellia bacterium]
MAERGNFAAALRLDGLPVRIGSLDGTAFPFFNFFNFSIFPIPGFCTMI